MKPTATAFPDVRPLVDSLIARALDRRASDIYVEPVADGFQIRFRMDGLLETIEQVPAETGESIVNRLMVMGHLLTYRRDIPQEGRISMDSPRRLDVRLSVIPTLHGPITASMPLSARQNSIRKSSVSRGKNKSES